MFRDIRNHGLAPLMSENLKYLDNLSRLRGTNVAIRNLVDQIRTKATGGGNHPAFKGIIASTGREPVIEPQIQTKAIGDGNHPAFEGVIASARRDPIIRPDLTRLLCMSGVGDHILGFLDGKSGMPTGQLPESQQERLLAAETDVELYGSGPGSGYGGGVTTAAPGSSGSGASQELPPSGALDSLTPAAESGPEGYTGAGTTVAGPRPPAGSSGGATGRGR